MITGKNNSTIDEVIGLFVFKFTAHSFPSSPAKVRWHGLEKLSGYSSHAQPFEAPRNVAIACFYIAVFLFFEMAWDYCSGLLCTIPGPVPLSLQSTALDGCMISCAEYFLHTCYTDICTCELDVLPLAT